MSSRITPTLFDGHNINDATYEAKFLIDSPLGDIFESEQVSAEVAGDFGIYISSQPQGRALKLRIKLKSNTWANLKQLRQWMNTRQGQRLLKATNDNGNTLRLRVKPLAMGPAAGWDAHQDVIFWVARPVWDNDTEDDSTESITASGERWTITNDGSDDVPPVTTISPVTYKAATDAARSMRHIVFANRSARTLQDANGNPWPVDITDGGWDVETKVKAGTLHGQGYDIRTFGNQVETNRYLSNYGAGFGAPTQAVVGAAELQTFHDSAVAWHAQMMYLPGCTDRETNTVDEIQLFMQTTGTPVGTMRVKIYARAASTELPFVVITNGTSDTVTVGAGVIDGTLRTVSFTWAGTKPVLSAKFRYWIVIDPSGLSTNNASNYVSVNSTNSVRYEGHAGGFSHSADGATGWTTPGTATGGHLATHMYRQINFRAFVTGTAKVWVPMIVPPSTHLTLLQGLASNTFEFVVADEDGHARLPDRGCVLVGNVTDGYEAITYKAKVGDRQLLFGKLGARGSTAAASHKAGDSVYLMDLDVRIVFNYQSATLGKGEFEPDALAPAIDGVNSTNEEFWSIGPYLSPANENRPMRWRTQQDDTVELYGTVSVDLNSDNDVSDITFKDAIPATSFIGANTVYQDFPTGIKVVASAITLDEATIPASLQLEHLLTNDRGEESLFATHRINDQGTAKTLTLTDQAYRYRIRAANGLVTGAETGDAEDSIRLQTVNQANGMTVVLEEATAIAALAFRLKRDATKTFTVKYAIYGTDASGVPAVSNLVAETGTFTEADISSASYTTKVMSFASTIRLAAGTYWFGVTITVTNNGTVLNASQAPSVFSGGQLYYGSTASTITSTDSGKDLWFRIYGTPNSTTALSGTNGTADIDTFKIKLDDATPGTPYVGFEAADLDVYLLDATFENTSTADPTGIFVVEPLDNSETTLDVSDARAFLISRLTLSALDTMAIKIDSEVMTVSTPVEGVPDTINVVRAAYGTAAVTHNDDSEIYMLNQRARLFALMQTGQELVIDWANMTVLHSDDDLARPEYLTALHTVYEREPFKLGPGANVLSWTEVGVVATNVSTRFREPFL